MYSLTKSECLFILDTINEILTNQHELIIAEGELEEILVIVGAVLDNPQVEVA